MMRRGLAVGLVMLTVALQSPGQPNARAWADSTHYRVGDPITVHVEVEAPSPITPLFGDGSSAADTLGVFSILNRKSFKGKEGTHRGTITVAAYDSGTAILPPMEFSFISPADSSAQIVRSNPLVFSIRLVEVDTAQGIKDIKPVIDIPLTVAEISLTIGSLIGLVLLGYFIYTTLKRRRAKQPQEEAYVPLLKPAHEIALEELAILKEKRLWQQGLIKPYYSEVTEIVRRYFENRFGFKALEETTDEILAELRRFDRKNEIVREVEAMLRRADLVKFAKHQPSIPEHEEMMRVAYDIIENTKVAGEALSAKSEKANEVAHV